MWMTKRFIKSLGYEKTKAMYEANSIAADITIAVNTMKTNHTGLKAELEQSGVIVKENRLVDNFLHISKTSDLSELNAFKAGLFHVMDESAAMAVSLARPQKNMKIIDLCAAPGGKSFYASYLTENTGEITACDIYPHKLELIEMGAKRLGLNVTATLSDGTVINEKWRETADIVLFDAPCSGLGLLRRKPDIKFKKQEEVIAEMARIQRDIFQASWEYVKKGGVLLYSTCTLTEEENQENVRFFTENYPFESEEEKLILPQNYGTDGFYMVKLRRK